MPTRGDPRYVSRDGRGSDRTQPDTPDWGGTPGAPNSRNRQTRVVTRPGDPGWRPDPGDTPDPGTDPGGSGIAPRSTRRRDPVRRTLTVGANNQILPIVYGKTEVGSMIPYGFARGADVWLKFKICEGPIQGIENLTFGDSTETSFATLGLIEGVDYNIYLGTPGQGIDPILAASQAAGTWNWADPAAAYVALRYNVARAGFENITPDSFRCTVLGRLVNDPRTDDADLPFAQRAYSENPALCLLDFIRNRRFGMGRDLTEIDLDSFSEAADDCDDVIATLGGGTEPDGAPTASVLTSTTGQIENGTFRWALTWVDTAGVESLASPVSNEIVISAATPTRSAKLVPTGTAPPSQIVSYRLYRARKGPGSGGTWGPLKRVPLGTIPKTVTFLADVHPTSRLGGQPPLSSSIAKFRIGMRIDQDESIGETVKTMRTGFTAVLVYNDGKYQCYVDKARTATDISYDAGNTIGIPTLRGRDPSDAPSQIVLHFVNAALGFKPDEVAWPKQPVAPAPGVRSDRIIAHYTCENIPYYYQALIVVKWLWERLNAEFEVEWQTHHSGARPLPMSIVTGAWSRAGISSRDVTLSAVGLESRNTWRLKGELGITYDYTFQPDPGHDPIVVDPPPPSSPPAPSDDYILQIGLSIGHVAPLPG